MAEFIAVYSSEKMTHDQERIISENHLLFGWRRELYLETEVLVGLPENTFYGVFKNIEIAHNAFKELLTIAGMISIGNVMLDRMIVVRFTAKRFWSDHYEFLELPHVQ